MRSPSRVYCKVPCSAEPTDLTSPALGIVTSIWFCAASLQFKSVMAIPSGRFQTRGFDIGHIDRGIFWRARQARCGQNNFHQRFDRRRARRGRNRLWSDRNNACPARNQRPRTNLVRSDGASKPSGLPKSLPQPHRAPATAPGARHRISIAPVGAIEGDNMTLVGATLACVRRVGISEVAPRAASIIVVGVLYSSEVAAPGLRTQVPPS